MLRLAAACFILTLPAVAAAHQACDSSTFVEAGAQARPARVSQVDGRGRLFFQPAPDARPRDPRPAAYLVKGDQVLVRSRDGALSCAMFKRFAKDRTVETVGWLPTTSLTPVPTPPPTPAAWSGYWVGFRIWGLENSIVLRPAAKGQLSVEGEAFWVGSREGIEKGGVHVGALEGRYPVRGAGLGPLASADGDLIQAQPTANDFDCKFGMALVGDWLLVTDNGNCGGANVTFSGVYRRLGPPPANRPNS